MRVLLCTDELEGGGLQRVVVTIANHLAQRGVAVAVAAAPGGNLWDDVAGEVDRLFAPSGAAARARWLARLVRSGRFDVVHAHQRGVALVARAARAGLPGVRVVEHVHNVFDPDWRRVLAFRGDVVVACGEEVRNAVVTRFHRPRERTRVLPNAVPDAGRDRDLTLPSAGGARVRVTALARAEPQKDPSRFLDVIALVNRDGIRVDAAWVGHGSVFEEVEARARRQGVAGIDFRDWPSTGVAESLTGTDVVVLTSRWEGMPLILLEAAAMGRAVVAPRTGSIPEVVEDGRTGLLFDVDAPAAQIAALLEGLVTDPERLRAMGAAARRRFEQRFDLDRYVDQLLAIYTEVLDSAPSRRRSRPGWGVFSRWRAGGPGRG